jgi:hypothetical protein
MLLGETLVALEYVTRSEVDAALERQRREGRRLGTILVSQGALSMEQLMDAVKTQRDIDAATEICQRTLASWQTIYGSDHPNTNRARYNLACALLESERHTEAAKLAEAALAGHREWLGAADFWTRDSAQLAAAIRRSLRDLKRP